MKHSFLCYRSGEISSPDVEIAGGIDEPHFPGNPGLFIGWVKPGSDADRLLSPGCQLTKVSGFFVNTKNYEHLKVFQNLRMKGKTAGSKVYGISPRSLITIKRLWSLAAASVL